MLGKIAGKCTQGLKKSCKPSLIVALEIIAILAVVLIMLVAFALWRVAQGPMDLGFAHEYIEKSLNSPTTPYSVKIGKAVLNWEGVDTPVRLDLSNLTIKTDQETVLSIRDTRIHLYKRYLLLGQVAPKAFVISEPVLKIIRTKDNAFRLDIQDEGSPEAETDTEAEAEKDTDFVTDFLRRLSNSPDETDSGVFSRLRRVEVQNARLIVEDQFVGVTWFVPETGFDMQRSPFGLRASADLFFPGGGSGNTHVHANARIARGLSSIDLEAQINNASLSGLSQKIYPNESLKEQSVDFSAHLQASLSGDLRLRKASLKANSESGQIILPQYYDAPLAYDQMNFEASYTKETKKLEIEKIGANIRGLDLGVRSTLQIQDGMIEGPLHLTIPAATVEEVRNLHPDKVRDEDVDKWLFQKIRTGKLSELEGKIDLSLKKVRLPEQPDRDFWRFQVLSPELEFNYRDLDIAYADGLTPVSQGGGQFSLKGEDIAIGIDEGQLGKLTIKSGSVNVSRVFTNNSGAVDLDAELEGPLRGIVDYIQVERLKNRINYEFQPELVKGQADFTLRVDFPTADEILFETIEYNIDGVVADGYWPDALEGVALTGGPFDIRVTHRDIELKGRGKLANARADLHWHEYFDTAPQDESRDKKYDSKITASVESTDELRLKLGVGLEDHIFGILPVEVEYISPPGPDATATVTGDLDDLSVYIDFLNFKRQPLGGGDVVLTAEFFDGDLRKIRDLRVKSADMSVKDGQLSFIQKNNENHLSAGNLEQVAVANNEFDNIAFEMSAEDVLKLKASGPFLDARWFVRPPAVQEGTNIEPNTESFPPVSATAGDKDGLAKVISADFDQMIMDPEYPLSSVKLYIQTDEAEYITQLEMDAVAGEGDIYLRYKPDEQGDKGFRLEVDDAGAGLRSFGFYDNVIGGELTIFATPKTQAAEGNFEGRMVLRDFKVTEAPVLAQLISAMSLPGIAQLLDNDGVQFSRLESKIDWRYQPKGARIILKDGRTSGNSLGLTFEGVIDRATERVDVSGTIVPVSGLNTLISNIPLIGNVFAGDQGEGVFAATYDITGPVKNPKVSVNPLAVLAPGFLRNILFEDRKDDTRPPEEDKDKAGAKD